MHFQHSNVDIVQSRSVDYSSTTEQLFNQQHHGKSSEFRAWTNDNGADYDLEKQLTIRQVASLFPRLNNISFECTELETDVPNTVDDDLMSICPEPIPSTANAFGELMRNSKKRFFPTPKSSMSSSFNQKEELRNEVASIFKNENIDFPTSDEAHYCVSVLTNALWYVTNHHQTISDAQKHHPNIIPIPEVFANLEGYNDVKRKKIKSVQLRSPDLNSHSQALYALLLRPGKKTKVWKSMAENVKLLADSLIAYKEYLDEKTQRIASVHESMTPARQLSEGADIKHVPPTNFVDTKYDLIDRSVKQNGLHSPIMLEDLHLSTPFEDKRDRFRFFDNFRLSVPVDVIRFCPGGSCVTTTCITQVDSDRTTSEILSDGATLIAKLRPELKEFHTRAQRRQFKRRIENVGKVDPTLLDVIYKEFALDATVANHPETETRIHAMVLGAPGLVADLRSLNPGRPGGTYDLLFEKMSDYLNELTSCDDRRHGGAHMSQWLSLQD